MEKESKLTILTRGLIKENPTLVLLLGTCPFLATSTSTAQVWDSPRQRCSYVQIS